MNTSDLRFVKTEKNIESVYISLKRQSSDVRVGDICREALINRSTFYSHYKDMPELEDKMRHKYVRGMLDKCPDVSNFMGDITAGCMALIAEFLKEGDFLFKLFNKNSHLACAVAEDEFFRRYLTPDADENDAAKICFAVGGVLNLFLSKKAKDNSQIAYLVKSVIEADLAGHVTSLAETKD